MSTRDLTWYVAGPMTGIPAFNFPEFDRVTKLLRNKGYNVVSPAELDDPVIRAKSLASPDGRPFEETDPNTETWADFLARDVKLIADEVDGVCLLPGWENSKGAKLEAFVAILSDHEVALFDPEFEVVKTVAKEYVLNSIYYSMS